MAPQSNQKNNSGPDHNILDVKPAWTGNWESHRNPGLESNLRANAKDRYKTAKEWQKIKEAAQGNKP